VAKKRFYLVKRSDRLTEGKPTFYVRFRSEEGEFLPWRSTGKTTKTLAENWALQRLGQLPTKESLTFGAYAADWWTESCAYCEGRVARGVPITAGYRRVRRLWLDKYVLPRFKDVLLTKLSARMVEEWLLKLRKGSLSATTVNHVLRTLKIMTREAVRLGYLNTDPTASVRQLRETPEERGILTPQEIRQLFDEDNLEKAWAGDLRHFTLNMVAASCGLRPAAGGGARAVESVHSSRPPGGAASVEPDRRPPTSQMAEASPRSLARSDLGSSSGGDRAKPLPGTHRSVVLRPDPGSTNSASRCL